MTLAASLCFRVEAGGRRAPGNRPGKNKENAMTHADESTWIRRAQAGDREAFAALVSCHRPQLYRLLCGMTRDKHAAEDLTQDVLVKAWTHLRSFRPGTYFRP